MTDITLEIAMTWVEDTPGDFNRIVVIQYDSGLAYTQRQWIWFSEVAATLEDDVGLTLDVDYIEYEDGAQSKLADSFTIRVKAEEHYTMLKLHYGA